MAITQMARQNGAAGLYMRIIWMGPWVRFGKFVPLDFSKTSHLRRELQPGLSDF